MQLLPILLAAAVIGGCPAKAIENNNQQLRWKVRFDYLATRDLREKCASWLEGLQGDPDSANLADMIQLKVVSHAFNTWDNKSLLGVLFRCDQAAELVFADSSDTLRALSRLALTLVGDDPELGVIQDSTGDGSTILRIDSRGPKNSYYTYLVNVARDSCKLFETPSGSYTFVSSGQPATIMRSSADGRLRLETRLTSENRQISAVTYLLKACVAILEK